MFDKLTKGEKWLLLAIIVLLFPMGFVIAPIVWIALLLSKK